MPVFQECYHCQQREPGCHGRCSCYHREKALHAELKQQEKQNRTDGERVERERSEWIYRHWIR